MAFTNYITQTLFCYIVLNIFFKDVEITRKEIFIFVLIIWAIQLIWSKHWLDKFQIQASEEDAMKVLMAVKEWGLVHKRLMKDEEFSTLAKDVLEN